MLSVRLDNETQERIDNLAKATKRPKSFFVKEALANYLDDIEDYYEAMKRKKSQERELISFEELKVALDDIVTVEIIKISHRKDVYK